MTTFDPAAPPPPANPRLAGHEDAEALLARLAAENRLPNAMLITGLEGIGKATLAYRLARHLFKFRDRNDVHLSETYNDFRPDSREGKSLWTDVDDPIFHRVASGGHADLKTVRRGVDEKTGKPKSGISVEDIRGVPEFFAHTAGEGGWRIAVVDSADEMNVNAANALLKILEEPPERGLLLLISHRPQSLLPTIRSRCWRLVLRPLPAATVADLLADYAPALAEADARRIAELAQGSIGRALRVAEPESLALYREFEALLADPRAAAGEALHQACERAGRLSDPATYGLIAGLFRRWCAERARAAAVGAAPGAAPLDRWIELWENCDRMLARAEQVNLDRKQVLLTLFLALKGASP